VFNPAFSHRFLAFFGTTVIILIITYVINYNEKTVTIEAIKHKDEF